MNLLGNFVGGYAVSKAVKNFSLNGKTVPKLSITERQVQDPELMKSPIKTVYDVVDVPNNHMFGIKSKTYGYYVGLIGFLINLNSYGISLYKKRCGYSDITDWDSYLKEIMAEIELRILDEYVKAKGWL